ncbi:MAG: DUF2892 domain-containing protein [Hyphomicrobiaceae bacterium]
MKANVGAIDRIFRIVLGVALVCAALGLYGPAYTTAWGWIGIVPLITAVMSWCPVYALLGMKTCRA